MAGPVYSAVGADPATAATTFIAVDMGGYQLAHWLSLPKALQIEKQQLAEQTAAGMRTNECASMN